MLTKEADRIRKLKYRAELRDEREIAEATILNGRGKRTRSEYAEFIKGYSWDYFLTSTFRRPRHDPYYAIRSVWSELKKSQVQRAFLCAEPFQSGDLHIHGLASGLVGGVWDDKIDLPWDVWQRLFTRFGRAKVEACRGADAVAMYCAKYLLKQQDRVVDYYDVLGDPYTWRIGRLENRARF